MANDDQAKGAAKDIGGKIKETVGKILGNEEMKHDGQGDQVEGKTQEAYGDAKDAVTPDDKTSNPDDTKSGGA